jgi:uncharacterized protein (TIGR00159 family)
MVLFKLGFIAVRLVDLLDISMIGILIFQLHRLFRRTALFQVLILLLAVFVVWRFVDVLNMVLMRTVLREFIQVATLAIVVIFAPEIRRALVGLNRNTSFSFLRKQLSSDINVEENFQELVSAIEELAETRTGAIVVIQGETELTDVIKSGDMINADVSKRLLMSVFNPKSPLHDGAAIIQNRQLVAARCVLPVSDDPDLPPELGLRHRSALGVTEVSDAAAIIVSEETGKVSIAEHGRVKRNISTDELIQFLKKFYKEHA